MGDYEFADEGLASHEGSGHFGVVVGSSSGGLEDELKLAFGEVGIVIKDLSKGLFPRLLHGKFYGLDAAEGVFDQLRIIFQGGLGGSRCI